METKPLNVQLPLGIMVLTGFVVGLFLSFGIARILGFSPALFWPTIVIFFLCGVFFLAKPKFYLLVMFLFYGVFSGFVAFGGARVIPISLPMEGILDEMFLAVPLAVIVMKVIRREQPPHATRFWLFFPLLAALSWYVNQAPMLNSFRVTLSYMKLYILWYFVRCIGPWSLRERKAIFVSFVLFVLLQFFVNAGLWQKHIVLRLHPDFSVGTIGNAHFVGYLCAFGIFMLGAWLLLRGRTSMRLSFWALVALVLISYNLIFLTDTKHLLFILPFLGMPLLAYPGFSIQKRTAIIIAAVAFFGASYLYFVVAKIFAVFPTIESTITQVMAAGKGATMRVIFTELPRETPFFPLGAGPGNYCSSVALNSMRPLAIKYVLPYTPWAYGGRTGISTSFLGGPGSGFFTVLGEFGIMNAFVYFSFWAYVLRFLWRSARNPQTHPFDACHQLALFCCIVMFLVVNVLFEVFTVHIFVVCLAVLLGIQWDIRPEPTPGSGKKRRVLPASGISRSYW